MNFPLDRPKIFGWQDNQFTSHDSENSDRWKEEKPFSLQKLKVWFDPVRLFGLYACVCENENTFRAVVLWLNGGG